MCVKGKIRCFLAAIVTLAGETLVAAAPLPQADQSESALRRACEEAPADAAPPRALGDFYAARGRFTEAMDMYRQSIARDPAQVEAYAGFARIAMREGLLDEAAAAYTTALTNDPRQPVLYFEYGVLEASLGRADEAIALMMKAIDLKPDYVQARENLAGLYCMTGRFRAGIAHFKEALRLEPDDAQTHELIARAYMAIEQWSHAEAHALRALELNPGGHGPRQLLAELDAARVEVEAMSVEAEVARNILGQVVGEHTLAAFGLPGELIERAADRIIRESFRARYRRVAPGETDAAQPTAHAAAPDAAPSLVRVHRCEIPEPVQRQRGRYMEDRPALRGFQAPILERAGEAWPTEPPTWDSPQLAEAARLVGERLAVDGLLKTLVMVAQTTGPAALDTSGPAGLDLLRSIGLPVDLLAFFEVDGRSGDANHVVAHVCRRLAGGESAEALAADLATARFRFTRSRADFQVATDSGEHDAGLVRLGLTGAGGSHDLARQLVEALPEADFLACIGEQHLESFLAQAATWPIERSGRFTVIPQALPVAQWAQDNGRSGLVGSGPAQRPATIVPRYASRREDGSVFVPGESFIADGLASCGHVVIHSPLLFQGGNLIVVRDPRTGRRWLLIGEAEIARNVALGLSASQVREAFAVEFGVARATVLPAVSFHIDYDLSPRSHEGRLVAFVNDEDAAVRIILTAGIGALTAAGVLDEPAAAEARRNLESGESRRFLEIVHPPLLAQMDGSGRFPAALASHFAAGPFDSPATNLERFLVALDVLISRALPPQEWPADRHAQSYFRSLERRRADRAALHQQLRALGFELVSVPSLADEEWSLNYLNGIQERSRYLVPAVGGIYAPLDAAAAAAFRQRLGDAVAIVPILCGESQRRVGAVHCSAAVCPRPER